MQHHDMLQVLLPKFLDIFIGVITFGTITWRWKTSGNNTGLTKDLIKEIEQKDREIEQLHTQAKAWKMRHDHVANECRTKHKHLQTS